MTRANTLEEVERQVRVIGFPVAFHSDGPAQLVDRYYAHSEEMLAHQIERALEAAKKNNADGVLVLPFPNCRGNPARPS